MDKTANKSDLECQRILQMILSNGCYDKNPRPKWNDGTPAHTISVNGVMSRFNLANGEFPILTLRPVAWKSAIGEILWIYQQASNDLNLLKDKYGITWWDSWDIGDRTIGCCYGETVRRYNLMHNLLDDIEKDPDGRRHIINLWQEDCFKEPHGLKPCCYQTQWNVRHGKDGIDYLDMALYQRSCDYITAGCTINQTQYATFLCMVAHHFGYAPGVFTWFCENVQIYDRHIEAAKKMLKRNSIVCSPKVEINPEKKSFWDLEPEDIKIVGYPRKEIMEKNPQIKLEVAV